MSHKGDKKRLFYPLYGFLNSIGKNSSFQPVKNVTKHFYVGFNQLIKSMSLACSKFIPAEVLEYLPSSIAGLVFP